MSCVAIIPARSGSVRVKDKNIYPFKGKPLMAWTIESAVKSGMFDRIIVSTNSETYAAIGRQYGAEVPFLRDKYADNASSIASVAYYAALQAEEYFKETYDNLCVLQATCPLRDEFDIKNAMEFFYKNNVKALITATKYTMNPWWGATLDENQKPTFVLFSPEQCSSSSKPPMYCPNGAVIVVNKSYLEQYNRLYTDELKFSIMDSMNAIDIDTYEDIEMASFFYDLKHRKKDTDIPYFLKKEVFPCHLRRGISDFQKVIL